MNYRQVETSREIRLWITGIIAPVLTATAMVIASDPELLQQAKGFVKRKKDNISAKFSRKRDI